MFKLICFMACLLLHAHLFAQQSTLPLWNARMENPVMGDWLVKPVSEKAGVYLSSDKKDVILYNGLVKRTFRLSPNVACIGYKNMVNGQQLLRSVKPEARITLNGVSYEIGGLNGQKENAYLLPEWVDRFTKNDSAFYMTDYRVSELQPYVKWKSNTWSSNKKQPTGKQLTFNYRSLLAHLKDVTIAIRYELYDGIPLIVKSLTVHNKGSDPMRIDRVVNEVLGLVEEESAVVGSLGQMQKPQGIYVETNYAFNNAMRYDLSDQTAHWKTDSSYTSQVNYYLQTPCVLEIYPEYGPGVTLKKGDSLNSVRSYELLMDSYDRMRRGLIKKRMYSVAAPWTTQNPIFMHLVSKNDEEVTNAIDQCAATGYEAVILSFGSHLNMEDSSAANIAKWKKLADYAHSKGILLGGYSLFSSRRISEEHDVINPKTGKTGDAFFGNAPCFGSSWGLAYRDKIKHFFTATGFDIWENDGPYPGDLCASVSHPGHEGVHDSQWRQMEIQKELYRWLNEHGVYINAPDWYFLDGTHKIAIGYREVNFSLSREQQKILNRQNIHDGTIEKTASMSWGFVPLTKYHGGGPEAVLEPLSEHLEDYEQLMMQYYGAGVQACYRGPRLYDTDRTRSLVIKTINWYKKYRDILNTDMIQLRRADGRDWDGWMHVSVGTKHRGLMMLFNPTKEKMTRTISVPMYYTGLTDKAMISDSGGAPQQYKLDRNFNVALTISLEPESYKWLLVE